MSHEFFLSLCVCVCVEALYIKYHLNFTHEYTHWVGRHSQYPIQGQDQIVYLEVCVRHDSATYHHPETLDISWKSIVYTALIKVSMSSKAVLLVS